VGVALIPTEAWEYGAGDALKAVLSLFEKERDSHLNLKGIGGCLPVRSGRVGILLSLQALNLKKGSAIGVPLYCCPVVFKAIKAAGYSPVFIDVNPENYCLSLQDLAAKIRNIDALIAVHMFGHVADMPAILKIMQGKPVIEDCAQSLGSSINGKLTGKFGSISIFSFRSGKYLTAGEGAAIYCQEPELKIRLESDIQSLLRPQPIEEVKHVVETWLRSQLRSWPLWGLAGSKIWKIYNKEVDFIKKTPIALSQVFKSDLTTIKRRLANLEKLITVQREHAQYYLENLRLPGEMFCHEPPGYTYNRFMFPIKLHSEKEYKVLSYFLFNKNISTSRPYFDVIEGATKYYGYKGDCPQAEHLLKTTLVVPVHYKLREKDLKHISNSVNLAWQHYQTFNH
jgi:dTDP-4-amino-4,6-dideoxygalactose transaminase